MVSTEVGLASSPTRDAARHEPLRVVMVVGRFRRHRDLIRQLDRCRAGLGVAASLRTGLDAGKPGRTHQSRTRRRDADIDECRSGTDEHYRDCVQKKRDLVTSWHSTGPANARGRHQCRRLAVTLGGLRYIPNESTREAGRPPAGKPFATTAVISTKRGSRGAKCSPAVPRQDACHGNAP